MSRRTILLVGATGQQGTAVLTALSRMVPVSGRLRPHILALTRDPTSNKAQGLPAVHADLDLTVLRGDLDAPSAIFAGNPGIHAVFLYTAPPNEAAHGIPLVNAAAAAGVDHIVFSSVDRGGDAVSWGRRTDVNHFAQKHDIEVHLRETAGIEPRGDEDEGGRALPLRWTILRPTAFFDNFNANSTFGAIFASMWDTMPPEQKLQLVSVHDVGAFGARALLEPENWSGRAIGLAGQELTLGEAKEIFRQVVRDELPETYLFVGRGVRWAIGDMERRLTFTSRQGMALISKS
jgi:uncharacterized protein YbjT (DUF2867 family)